MKITKSQISNLIFLALIAVLLFTPIGTQIKVYINRVFAFSPTIEKEGDTKVLDTYQWKLWSLDGNAFNFEETKGKVVLVNFWATWCPPCIAEMPSLQKLYNNYKNEVVFIFISNEEKETIKKFLNKNDYSFPVYHSSQSPEALEHISIPATYLIDANGNILIDEKGAADWYSEKVRQKLDELLSR
ncbi:TlpA family protein disulfide reductase [Galbibacter mesophilus]|uniref:TlpA family protein disulfide reductase n=1 Tax=Galbibacter mesophilus TaxID=379069 RepID=UPI00191F6D75|nr:TlpA disulfide reductase family protein [Galbibacter mesophilus]MCM5663903.1 TlpA family protein disulfide reductase [Galbibacter mesophilus]